MTRVNEQKGHVPLGSCWKYGMKREGVKQDQVALRITQVHMLTCLPQTSPGFTHHACRRCSVNAPKGLWGSWLAMSRSGLPHELTVQGTPSSPLNSELVAPPTPLLPTSPL